LKYCETQAMLQWPDKNDPTLKQTCNDQNFDKSS
jgi:hypothetical protein